MDITTSNGASKPASMLGTPPPAPADAKADLALLIVRWALMLPAAVLAGLAARLVTIWANRYAMFGEVSIPGQVIERYAAGLILGATVVYVACAVAPSFKKVVAVGVAGLVLVVSGFFLFPSVLLGDGWAILELACLAVGSCAMAAAIFQGDNISV
jgi:hypothetical protein